MQSKNKPYKYRLHSLHHPAFKREYGVKHWVGQGFKPNFIRRNNPDMLMNAACYNNDTIITCSKKKEKGVCSHLIYNSEIFTNTKLKIVLM